MKRLLFLLLTLSFSPSTYGIDLIIGGKTYYIKKFEIKDDGKTIVIPYTIHLSEKAFEQSDTCSKPQRNPARFKPSSIQESSIGPSPKKHPYNQLINDLEGQYKKLTDGLKFKKKRRKRNFR